MTYEPQTQQVAFVLPLYFSKAEIIFTRPALSFDYITFRITPALNPRHVVSTKKLEKGTWLAQLIWSEGRSQYFTEKMIEIG